MQNQKIKDCLINLIGWKDHYDTNEISTLGADIKKTISGEYFQDFHPALRLDLISASLPDNRSLEDYLKEKKNIGITKLYNQIILTKKLDSYRKELLANGNIIEGLGYRDNKVIDEGRFVGILIKNNTSIGLATAINKIGIQATQAQTDLTIYLYHSAKNDPVKEFTFTSDRGLQWSYVQIDQLLDNYDDGYWIIGYYQEDLTGEAISYNRLNWKTGFCNTCRGGVDAKRYNQIKKYVAMNPIYVPGPAINTDRSMFDLHDAIEVFDNNFGINLNFSVKCNLQNFICDHRSLLTEALGLQVALLILQDIKYSQQINHIEESLKDMIIRDLEGDKDTHHDKLPKQLQKAIEGINVDLSNLSDICLPCTKKNNVKYGTA